MTNIYLAFALLVGINRVYGASFVDDKGTKHTFKSNAKILCGAMDAVAFYHFGMSYKQIGGTFGERSSSGSNYGGKYSNGNLADHGDHSKVDHNPEHFPADPDESERAFLNMITDYSPSCSSSNYYCSDVDIDALNKKGWPDIVIAGSFYSSLVSEEFRGNATEAGVPIIELTTSYGSSPGDEVLPRSMVEITQTWENLAGAFLGADTVASTVENDKKELCSAAKKFKDVAKKAQNKGVRAMAGYLPYTGTGPNGEVGAFLASPERDTVLAMLEELGMAILHNDAEPSRAYEYQVDANFLKGELAWDRLMSKGTVGDPVQYYVDFWLYDDRVTLDFISDSFAQAWPHKAVVSKQYAYFPANSRIFSYRHAAEILKNIAEPLEDAKQLFTTPTTQCTSVDGGVAGDEHRSKGLLPGQYACFEPIEEYDFCGDDSSATFDYAKILPSHYAMLAIISLLVNLYH